MTLFCEFTHQAPGGTLHIGTIGKTGSTVDYTAPFSIQRQQEKELLASVTAIESSHIVFLDQVHGDGIITLREYPSNDAPTAGEADALVSALPGLCLVIRTADCAPVFLFDPHCPVMAAVHSGWRGCQLGISGKALGVMVREYGADPRRIRGWVLPAISPRSYRIQDDVGQFFPHSVHRHGNDLHLDIPHAICSDLELQGVPREQITVVDSCTLENRDMLFSHRRGDSGRNLNFCWLR
jgi:polyphenol oxidase